MAEKFGADCPCGFTFTTPHGQEEALAITTIHIQRTHPELPTTREAVLPFVKKR